MFAFLVFQIMSELMANGVQIYHFPVDDETVADTNKSMNVSEVKNNLKNPFVKNLFVLQETVSVELAWSVRFALCTLHLPVLCLLSSCVFGFHKNIKNKDCC